MLSLSMQKGRYLCLAIIIVVCFLAHGCGSKAPYKTKEKKIVRKMLVTGYDAGKKSTGWKRKLGLFFLPPVYAYGPNEGKRKEVGVTSDGTKAKKEPSPPTSPAIPTAQRCMSPVTAGGRCMTSAAPSRENISISFSPVKKRPKNGGSNTWMSSFY